jgi:hypothetical protein
MKIIPKGLFIPLQLFETHQLSWHEKAAMLYIDATTDDPMGSKITSNTISKEIGVSTKEAKEILNSLHKKGAIQASVDEDGVMRVLALLYKESYVEETEKNDLVGEKQTRTDYDYEAIQSAWQQANPNLPAFPRFTPKRKRMMRNTLTQNALSVDALMKAFRIIGISEFLQGKNQHNWSATFDWLIKKPETLEKVLSGNYCNSYVEKQRYYEIMNGAEISGGKEEAEDDVYK